jgi:hypothetical protein
MRELLYTILAVVTLFTSSFAIAEGQAAQHELPYSGISHRIQQYPAGSKSVLMIEMFGIFGRPKERFGISFEHADENIEILSKFLKWTAIAKERGDDLNREMGVVKGFDKGGFTFYNKYDFETINGDYYLGVVAGNKLLGFKFTPSIPEEDASSANPERVRYMSFDASEVASLISLIQDFKSGKLKPTIPSSSETDLWGE